MLVFCAYPPDVVSNGGAVDILAFDNSNLNVESGNARVRILVDRYSCGQAKSTIFSAARLRSHRLPEIVGNG